MSTTVSAPASIQTSISLYDDEPFTQVQSFIQDESSTDFLEIDAKVQITAGGHTVVLDFSAYGDPDHEDTRPEALAELRAVNRLLEDLSAFRDNLAALVRDSLAIQVG